VPSDVEEDYAANLAAMVRTLADRSGDDDPLILNYDAHELLRAFETDLEPRLGRTGDLAHITDWASKLTGQLVRIAALLHVATHLRDGYGSIVRADALSAAFRLADYFIAHALAVFDLMGADQLTDDAGYVLRWLADHDRDTFIARDLYTANRSRFPTADALDPVLAHLVTFGWIRAQPQPSPNGRGRPPSPVWAVHPLARQQKQQ
jgi:hypothetical protein